MGIDYARGFSRWRKRAARAHTTPAAAGLEPASDIASFACLRPCAVFIAPSAETAVVAPPRRTK
ncbi:hypothetical protein LC55x_1426 [Lysobacter capsici]|nr:hypothetical protein LC55x_1426 [Lysobacter capsici]